MHAFHDPAVDHDHDVILNHFSQLYGTLCFEPSYRETNRALLQQLEQYTLEHFAREEAVMEAHAYPARAAHQRAHETLRRALQRWLATLDPLDESVETCLATIRDKFLAHIVVWDDAYGAWIEKQV